MGLAITQGLYPSSTGWTFIEQGATIRGDNCADLISKVAAFRSRNGFPKGDPVKEVVGYICSQNPGICKQNGRPLPSNVGQKDPGTFGDRVVQWITEVGIYGPKESVDRETISARAEVCRGCPHNVNFVPTCTTCNKTPLRIEAEVAAKNPPGTNTGLGACQHYNWANKMAIRFPTAPDPRAPSGCWR